MRTVRRVTLPRRVWDCILEGYIKRLTRWRRHAESPQVRLRSISEGSTWLMCSRKRILSGCSIAASVWITWTLVFLVKAKFQKLIYLYSAIPNKALWTLFLILRNGLKPKASKYRNVCTMICLAKRRKRIYQSLGTLRLTWIVTNWTSITVTVIATAIVIESARKLSKKSFSQERYLFQFIDLIKLIASIIALLLAFIN